jgi:hypothetical protein
MRVAFSSKDGAVAASRKRAWNLPIDRQRGMRSE